MSVKFQITGDKEIARALRGLVGKETQAVAVKALATAVAPVVTTAKAAAGISRESGLLQDSIGLRIRQYSKTRKTIAYIGPDMSAGGMVTRISGLGLPVTRYSKPFKYAHLVELGTSHSPAKPFLRPALWVHEAAIQATLGAIMGPQFEKIAAKYRKRTAKK